jgi:glycosyltransferase involved in cell wall biosynthesis
MSDALATHITLHAALTSPPVVMFLPAHDEEATVADVVRRAPAFVLGHPVEVAVVDDGSTDRTAEAAAAAGALVRSLGRNRGLGAAVREGLAWGVARGAAATAFLDADGEYAPEELAALVAPILEGRADYVIGSRFAGLPSAMRPHRWLGNRTLTLAMKLLVRRWGVRGVTDGQSGYRALSRRAAADAEIVHDFNYAQVLTLDLVAKGFRYAEVPISYRFRQHGRSFVRLGPYLRRVVPAVWRELRSGSGALTSATPAVGLPVLLGVDGTVRSCGSPEVVGGDAVVACAAEQGVGSL